MFIQQKTLLSLLLLSLLLILITLPTLAANPLVLMIDIDGETQVPVAEILGAISATRIGLPFSEQAVYQDLKSIMNLGYFTSVKYQVEQFFDGLKVIFIVVENRPVKEIIISGLTKIDPITIKEFISLKPTQTYNSITLHNDISKASKHLFDKNGVCIEIKNINLSSDGIVNLELVELKVGKITVSGLEKTKEIVIRREFSLKEGDIFDSNILFQDIQKLMRLQLFNSINPDITKSSIPDALDINIKIQEAGKQFFTFSTSYEEKTGKTGFGIGYNQPNFMGLGQSLAFNIKTNPSSASFSYHNPWLDEKHTSFGLSVWQNDMDLVSTMKSWSPNLTDKYDLDLEQTGLSVSLGRPIGKYSKANVKMKIEKNEIVNFWSKDLNSREKTPETSLSIPEPQLHSQDYWDNTIECSISHNKLNYKSMFNIFGGHQIIAGYTYGGRILGNDFDYQKIKVEGKWFHQLVPNLVFGTRIEGAYLFGDYPDYNLSYIGGPNRLRGYDGQRFKDDDTLALIGSKYLLHSSELRYRIPKYPNLEFALFYDIGHVSNSYDTTKSDYGFGFRLELPLLGLVRVDRAWNEDGGSKTVFAIGPAF